MALRNGKVKHTGYAHSRRPVVRPQSELTEMKGQRCLEKGQDKRASGFPCAFGGAIGGYWVQESGKYQLLTIGESGALFKTQDHTISPILLIR